MFHFTATRRYPRCPRCTCPYFARSSSKNEERQVRRWHSRQMTVCERIRRVEQIALNEGLTDMERITEALKILYDEGHVADGKVYEGRDWDGFNTWEGWWFLTPDEETVFVGEDEATAMAFICDLIDEEICPMCPNTEAYERGFKTTKY